jgi:hypothetical protein
MADDIMTDIFNCDKSERRRILQETIYRIKWENLRQDERSSTRETRNSHRGDCWSKSGNKRKDDD